MAFENRWRSLKVTRGHQLLLPAYSYVLTLTCLLLPAYSYLLTLTCLLLSTYSYLLTLTCLLLHQLLLPAYSYLLTLTCLLLHQLLLPAYSYLLTLTCLLLHQLLLRAYSYVLTLTCLLLPAYSYVLTLTCLLLHQLLLHQLLLPAYSYINYSYLLNRVHRLSLLLGQSSLLTIKYSVKVHRCSSLLSHFHYYSVKNDAFQSVLCQNDCCSLLHSQTRHLTYCDRDRVHEAVHV
jgi:hypothetical protein